MSYQVILGVDDRLAAAELLALLEESGEFAVLGTAATAAELDDMLGGREPDVVLVHEGLGPLPTFDLVRQIGLRYPEVAVVVAVRDGTPEVYSAAMVAGARGVIPLPFTLEELQGRLAAAAAWSRAVRRHVADGLAEGALGAGGRLLVVAGAKGGTGATTVATHLALLAAAEPDRRVCLVDLDLQAGDVPSLLDLTHHRSVADLVEIAGELTSRGLEQALYAHPSGLRVLLAPPDGERAEDVGAVTARQVLAGIRSRFDLVVVDCGTVVTEAGAAAVELADQVLVVTTPDVASLRATRRLARLWARLDARKEDDLLVVLNRASRSSEVQPDLVRKVAGAPLARTTLPAAFRALEAAVNTGSPERLEGPLRRALQDLAREVGVVGRPAGRGRGEAGQSAVEFLGAFLLILALTVGIWQALLLGFGWTLAANAADKGARQLAVGAPVRPAVLGQLPGGWRPGAQVTVDPAGVTVRLAVPLVVPGWVAGPLRVSGHAAAVPER